jgi:tryptophan halogenase
MTDRLASKLDFWRKKRPTPADFEDQRLPGERCPETFSPSTSADPRDPVDTAGLWDHENYEAVMYGMDFLSRECDQWYGKDRPDTVVPPHIASRVAQAPAKLPPHTIWLQKVLGMPSYSTR